MVERLVHIVDDAEVLVDAGDLTLVCVLTGFLDAGKSAELAATHLAELSDGQGGGHLRRRLAARLPRPPSTGHLRARPLLRLRGAAPGRPRAARHRRHARSCCSPVLSPTSAGRPSPAPCARSIEHFGVSRVVSMGAVPMAVPHTRPIAITPHANRADLVPGESPWQGELRVPGQRAGAAGDPAGGVGPGRARLRGPHPALPRADGIPPGRPRAPRAPRDRRPADHRPQRAARGRRDHRDRGRPLPLLPRRGRRRRPRPGAAVRLLPRGRGGRHLPAGR